MNENLQSLMIKTPTILTILFLGLIVGCDTKKDTGLKGQFVLKGSLDGIVDQTWIHLMLDGKDVDSAQVLEKKFEMTGELNQAKQYYLLIKNTRNYTQIWLEPDATITFGAKGGEFRKAKITGSKTHMESEKLWGPIWEYRNRRDSLSELVSSDEINDSLKIKASFELDKVRKNHLKIETDFIKNNPDSYISASNLDFYSTTLGKNRVSELYNNFSERMKNSTYGQSIEKFLTLSQNIQIGDKYVDFAMENENGKYVELSDFEGNLILLDFWASWCSPCIEEYPALIKSYSMFKNDGFEIVSISEDQSKDRWIKSIEEYKLNWVNLWHEDGRKSDPYLIYGINGIPDNFLINEIGIVVARNLRGEKLIAAIEENLEKKAGR